EIADAVARGAKETGALFRALHFDGARDGVNLDAATAIAHAGAERVLSLFFNHERNLRTDLAAYGAGGKMEAGARGHRYINGAGNSFEVPIVIAAGIAFDGHATRGGVGLYVAVRIADAHRAAGSVRVHTPARLSYLNVSGDRMRKNVSFGVRDNHAARDARGM